MRLPKLLRRVLRTSLGAGCVVAISAVSAAAATKVVYVECGSSVAKPSGAWNKPYPTVQSAIDAWVGGAYNPLDVRVKAGYCCASENEYDIQDYPEYGQASSEYVAFAVRRVNTWVRGGWTSTSAQSGTTTFEMATNPSYPRCQNPAQWHRQEFLARWYTSTQGAYTDIQGVWIDNFTIQDYTVLGGPGGYSVPIRLYNSTHLGFPPPEGTPPIVTRNRVTNMRIHGLPGGPPNPSVGISAYYAPTAVSGVVVDALPGSVGVSVVAIPQNTDINDGLGVYLVDGNTLSAVNVGVGVGGYLGNLRSADVTYNDISAGDTAISTTYPYVAGLIEHNKINGGNVGMAFAGNFSGTIRWNSLGDPPPTAAVTNACGGTICGNTWASGAFFMDGIDATQPCP